MNAIASIHREKGEDALADMLGTIQLLGDGSSTIVVNPNDSPHTELSKLLVVYARRENGKYDLIVARATQKKSLSPAKVASAIGGSCGVCALGGAILYASNPLGWGVLAIGASLLTASGGKAAYDYNKSMENVVAGYICKELKDMGMIQIANDRVVMV